MRFNIDEPVSPMFVKVINFVYWVIICLIFSSFSLFSYELYTFIADLVKIGMVENFIRAFISGEENLSYLWLLFPVWWFAGGRICKFLKPWTRTVNAGQLRELFAQGKEYPIIENYLTKVSSDGRMISVEEYRWLDKHAEKQSLEKYWGLGKLKVTEKFDKD